MKEKRVFVIFNPVARAGEAEKDLTKIIKILDKSGMVYNYQLTKRPGHATEIAKKIVRHKTSELIIAAGGDGTVNEIASALLNTKVCLGILPQGIGNDSADNLGIPKEPEEVIALLKSGQERKIDVIEIIGENKKYYAINVLGIGFDAAVALWAQKLIVLVRKLKKYKVPFLRWEYLVYLAGVLLKMFFYKDQEIEVSTPEWQFQGSSMMITCANGRKEGRYFKVAPKALINDGRIDICLIGRVPVWQRIFYVLKGLQGKHLALESLSGTLWFGITDKKIKKVST